jgi:hypothetical protein
MDEQGNGLGGACGARHVKYISMQKWFKFTLLESRKLNIFVKKMF